MKKTITYYQCRFKQTAPLRLSNGENEITDSELMLDGRGLPFIPGTSFAGVLRSMVSDAKLAVELFGSDREMHCKNGAEIPSRVIVSDAVLPDGAKVRLSTRDGVGINENGTAMGKAKYNFGVAETDECYTGIIELVHGEADDAAECLNELMGRLAAQGISFGARTTRGYGHMNAEIAKKSFCMPDQISEWLDFDPFEAGAFDDALLVERSSAMRRSGRTIRAELEMKGSFSVRVYSSAAGEADFAPLSNINGRPVIPGTSWAGVFRHHMLKLAEETGRSELKSRINELFGAADDGIKRSSISFMETEITGGTLVTTVRTALDRFTMAPKNGALFTSAVCNGGEGMLEIRTQDHIDEALWSLLMTCLDDLNMGLLTVGGSSSIGLGIARIKQLRINGVSSDDACMNDKEVSENA